MKVRLNWKRKWHKWFYERNTQFKVLNCNFGPIRFQLTW